MDQPKHRGSMLRTHRRTEMQHADRLAFGQPAKQLGCVRPRVDDTEHLLVIRTGELFDDGFVGALSQQLDLHALQRLEEGPVRPARSPARR